MFYKKIQECVKSAMKEKDSDRRDVLRMAISKAQSIAKDNKCEITDDIMLHGIQKELKQLYQTISSLRGMENTDLYKATQYKINILSEFIPKMMNENEVIIEVEKILSKMDRKELNKGSAMKAVMSILKGKADNKIISKCVDSYLNNI